MNVFEIFAKLGLDTSEYDKGLDGASSKATSFAGKIGSGLKTAAKVGIAAVGAASTAVTAFGAASVKTGMSFDSSMSQVAATMGLSMEEMENQVGTAETAFGSFEGTLREFAQFMGANTAFSASEAADALNYMALAGYDAQTSMDMLPNVLNLAAAGSIDLAYASDMVTDASSALGLSLDETSSLVDKMAMASSKSNTSVAQLGEAILTVGGTAKNLAGGTTELSTALGILADNGVKGAEGGTALRNIILSLSAPTDKAAKEMEALGLEVFDAEGNMRPLNETFGDLNSILSTMTSQEQTQVLNTLFNKVDLKSVNALLANTGEGFVSVATALEFSGVEWDKYADKAWAANGAIDGIMGELLYNIQELGTSTEELQDYLHFEYDLDADDALLVIEAANAALESSGSRWEELSGYINDAQGSAQKMADTQLDNLAGDITKFKSALEGAQIVVSDNLTPSLREFVQFGTDGISTLTTAFKEGGLTGAMDALGGIIGDGISMLISAAPKVIDAAITLLEAFGKGLMDNLPQLMEAAVQIVMMISTTIIDNLPAILEAGLQMVLQLATGIAEALPELVPAIVDVVIQIVETLLDNIDLILEAAGELIIGLGKGLVAALPRLVEKIPVIITKTREALLKGVVKMTETGVELIFGLIAGIIKSIPSLVQGIKNAGAEMLNSFKAMFGIHSPSTVFRDLGQMLIQGLIDGIKSLAASVVGTVTSIGSSIKNGFSSIIKNAATWGKDMMSNFIDGVKDKISALKETVSSVASTVKSRLGFSEPEEGPLSNFHTYAPDMMKLFAQGIRENEHLITDQIQKSFDFGKYISGGVLTPQLALSGATSQSPTTSFGSITINVYGAQGQSERELADAVYQRFINRMERERVGAL